MKAYIFEIDDYLGVGYTDGDPDMQWCDAVRAEWADKFYPKGPSARDWIENGYEYSCAYCEHTIGGSMFCDECQDESETDIEGAVYSGDMVYCTQDCLDKALEEHLRVTESKDRCRAAFAERVPFGTVTSVWNGGGGCDCLSKNNYNASLHFTFAGSTMGESANHFCGGCHNVWLCPGDAETFVGLMKKEKP